jgi:hypothetical protein
MGIFSEKPCFKKPVLPEKPVKKPAFNLPAGFFNKTWVFSSPAFIAIRLFVRNLHAFVVFKI